MLAYYPYRVLPCRPCERPVRCVLSSFGAFVPCNVFCRAVHVSVLSIACCHRLVLLYFVLRFVFVVGVVVSVLLFPFLDLLDRFAYMSASLFTCSACFLTDHIF